MRNRDMFGPAAFDTFRGIDRHTSYGQSAHDYSYLTGGHDHNHDTKRNNDYSSDYTLGGGYGSSYSGRAPYGTSYGQHNDYSPNQHRGSYQRYDNNEHDYRNENITSQSRDWSNRGGISRDANRAGGSDLGYNRGTGYGHARYRDYDEGRHSDYNAYPSRDAYPHDNSRYNRDSSFASGRYGHNRDWAERASDEVRSWFGDDEAGRRRHRDDRYSHSRDYRGGFGNNRNDF